MTRIILSPRLAEKLNDREQQWLRANFAEFIALGENGEYEHIEFGKASRFKRPPDAVREKLSKVHLQPETANVETHQKWMNRFGHRSRKTSDRYLVYAPAATYFDTYCLIDIILEPAHQTIEDNAKVQVLADVAERFRNRY